MRWGFNSFTGPMPFCAFFDIYAGAWEKRFSPDKVSCLNIRSVLVPSFFAVLPPSFFESVLLAKLSSSSVNVCMFQWTEGGDGRSDGEACRRVQGWWCLGRCLISHSRPREPTDDFKHDPTGLAIATIRLMSALSHCPKSKSEAYRDPSAAGGLHHPDRPVPQAVAHGHLPPCPCYRSLVRRCRSIVSCRSRDNPVHCPSGQYRGPAATNQVYRQRIAPLHSPASPPNSVPRPVLSHPFPDSPAEGKGDVLASEKVGWARRM